MTKKQSKHSKIIIDLIKNKISITDALFQIKILLSDLHDESINSWIMGELEGYKNKDDIPAYRTISLPLYGRIQQVGLGHIIERTINIPVKIDEMDSLKVVLRNSISTIEKWKNEKPENLNMPVDLRIANHIADIDLNDYCQITSAWHPLPSSICFEISNAVKERILEVLIELEKKHGNLDEFSISINEDERLENIQIINNIIYKDDSVNIGNDNAIKGSTVGSKNASKSGK